MRVNRNNIKKLLIVIDNLAIGGAQNMVYELVNNLDRTNYHVTVLCYGIKNNSSIEEKLEKLCPVIYLHVQGKITLSLMWKVLRKITALKPDILHAHLGGITFALPWTLLHRKPLVVTAHTKPSKAFSSKNEKMLRLLGLKKKKFALVAVSKENHQACKRYFNVNDNKCFCVNNGIDLNRFKQKEHDDFVLINVARQDENKNQTMLLHCFARFHSEYPKTKLLLVGDGPLHEELVSQVGLLNLTNCVQLPGNVANTEDYYADSDVYIQCSHREAMPLSVLEAMATGLPIISTDVGGLKDVVQENGFLIPDNDEDALYRAIWQVYHSTANEKKSMSMASQRIVQGYSSESMARQYEKIYDKV